ncbi:nitroreductase family deazaflavin-dependent oxidoreductase [Nocardioides acrostichi]|uniref:Nitroreductase family deazaflavin-dependent oxidoreductase n=1 Tax=Nocardioides acrostichi TaxID=2784339 RepID=A0A930V2C0_9ACTN|nr:nitroreductase family deazaflavin-dependent oxidoreductase [Nocardioides acrostichi]MBF4162497.1 nitroreductase family deazaflavin-dependent oxidoreductase [Nocardioides acrostichi]
MGLLTPVAVKIGSIPWMPKLLPQIVWVDENLQKVSGGRVSVLDIAGLPNLTLTVPGRKSGVPRSVPLLCVPDGDTWLIAGSYFGGPKMPVWVYNLRAADGAHIRFGRREIDVVAEELAAGASRDAAWATMVGTWPNYRLYEERTDRLIPVFRLRPA